MRDIPLVWYRMSHNEDATVSVVGFKIFYEIFDFTLFKSKNFLSPFNLKQARLFADWYGGRLYNFCLDSPIDLKFGMKIVLGKISR